MGICSIESREAIPSDEVDIGGGIHFLLIPPSDEPEDSKDWLLLLWWRCLAGVVDVGVLDLDSARDTERVSRSDGISPRRSLASTNLSVTCRLRLVPSAPLRLLPLLPLRLLLTLSLPSMTFAGGGG